MTITSKLGAPLFAVALTSFAPYVAAQTSPPGPTPVFTTPQEPLSDIDCNPESNNPATPASQYPGSTFSNNPRCAINGTRSITRIDETRTATTLSGDYRVNFNGTLAIDGVPNVKPGSSTQVDAFPFYAPATVKLSSQYTGTYTNVPLAVLPKTGNPNDFAYFSSYSDFTNDVQSISVNTGGIAKDASGKHSYTYTVGTADPTAITGGNSTALTGSYKETDGNALVYGKITGAVTLVSNPPVTPPANGGPNSYTSPYALQYQTAVRETTRLDENGLTTPTISVSDGINMNGSKVTNLADGTDPGDAVNKHQLDGEASTRAAADAQLAASIDSEAAVRSANDAALAAGIDAEATTRAAQINAEAATRSAADAQLAAGIDAEAATRAAQINAEAATRSAADAQLAAGIDAEAVTRNTADMQLAAGIDQEATTRAAQINAEAATRNAADTQLAAGINQEAATRNAADTQLAAGINAEAATRATQINAEANARVATDTALNQMIADETTIRANADARLSQRIDATEQVDNALAQGLASESAARMASDNALSARIDAVGTRLDQVDSRLSRLDRKVSSSTAVAVAMGGATFLPDVRYNLTANVATYDGAQAGAVQFGAMVGPKIAVNAGVATGFNRGGKTAARAGFTIGW